MRCQWREKSFRVICIFSERLLKCELSHRITHLMQWEMISEWLADLLSQNKNILTRWVPRAPGNRQSWTESQPLHLPGHFSLVWIAKWSLNQPRSTANLFSSGQGTLWHLGSCDSNAHSRVEQRMCRGHRKWEGNKRVRSQLQPLGSFRLESGHLEMRADGQLWSLIQRDHTIKKELPVLMYSVILTWILITSSSLAGFLLPPNSSAP